MPFLTPRPRSLNRTLPALALLWGALTGPWAAPVAGEIPLEYQVKAAFLFNFTQFVTWPEGAFAGADEPFRIGILGKDPFDGFLDETVKGERVAGHPLVVERYGSVAEAKHCQLLFISRSEQARLGGILADLKGRTILTVGDASGFLKNGGMIRLIDEDNRIHFQIDLEAAKRADLSISSQVLRLAEIVPPGGD